MTAASSPPGGPTPPPKDMFADDGSGSAGNGGPPSRSRPSLPLPGGPHSRPTGAGGAGGPATGQPGPPGPGYNGPPPAGTSLDPAPNWTGDPRTEALRVRRPWKLRKKVAAGIGACVAVLLIALIAQCGGDGDPKGTKTVVTTTTTIETVPELSPSEVAEFAGWFNKHVRPVMQRQTDEIKALREENKALRLRLEILEKKN